MYSNRFIIFKFLIILPLLFPLGLAYIILQLYYELNYIPYYENKDIFGYLLSLFFYGFVILTIINLLLCSFTNPGEPTKDWSNNHLNYAAFTTAKIQSSFLAENPNIVLDQGLDHERYPYCDKCKLVTPPDTNHCNLCNKCTLRLDHHCPWVANCIGYRNQKYFILFCLYGGISSLILGFSLYPKSYEMITKNQLNEMVI